MRNTRPKYSAVLKFTPTDALTGSVRMKGDGPEGYDAQADVTPTSGNLIMTGVETDSAWPDTVKFYDPLVINWRASPDGGTIWLDAGMTGLTPGGTERQRHGGRSRRRP